MFTFDGGFYILDPLRLLRNPKADCEHMQNASALVARAIFCSSVHLSVYALSVALNVRHRWFFLLLYLDL